MATVIPGEDPMVATKESYGRPKSPGLAVLPSFFYMGLGHIYIGEIRKGILLILLDTASLALIFVLIGPITTPMLWVRGMVYAYESAENTNRQMAGQLAAAGHLDQEVELLPDLVLAEPLAEWVAEVGKTERVQGTETVGSGTCVRAASVPSITLSRISPSRDIVALILFRCLQFFPLRQWVQQQLQQWRRIQDSCRTV